MKQDEALDKWIEGEIPISRDSEGMARDAWHAAVKHTLEHVAVELSWRTDEYGAQAQEIADFVRNMKP